MTCAVVVVVDEVDDDGVDDADAVAVVVGAVVAVAAIARLAASPMVASQCVVYVHSLQCTQVLRHPPLCLVLLDTIMWVSQHYLRDLRAKHLSRCNCCVMFFL